MQADYVLQGIHYEAFLCFVHVKFFQNMARYMETGSDFLALV